MMVATTKGLPAKHTLVPYFHKTVKKKQQNR